MDKREGTTGRGFAGMDEEQQRKIASKGGRAAHEKGVAHQWNSQEAAEAGRKGGRANGKNTQGNVGGSEAKNLSDTDRLPKNQDVISDRFSSSSGGRRRDVEEEDSSDSSAGRRDFQSDEYEDEDDRFSSDASSDTDEFDEEDEYKDVRRGTREQDLSTSPSSRHQNGSGEKGGARSSHR